MPGMNFQTRSSCVVNGPGNRYP
ncbi:hypothetical protein [Otoolea muris]